MYGRLAIRRICKVEAWGKLAKDYGLTVASRAFSEVRLSQRNCIFIHEYFSSLYEDSWYKSKLKLMKINICRMQQYLSKIHKAAFGSCSYLLKI